MSLSTKILIGLGAMLLIIMGGFLIYMHFEQKAQLQAINQQLTAQKQLVDNITRSSGTYVTKDDMNAFATDNKVNLDAITKDLATLNANLVAMNKISVDSNGEKASNLPSTSTTPNTNPPTTNTGVDPYGYSKNIQNLHLNEQFANNTNVPIGDVSFDASNAKPWGVNILPREYNAVTTIGTDETGKVTAYNNFSIKAGDKTYPINVTNAQLVQQYPAAHFTFWPRLYLGVDGGVNVNTIQGEINPNVSIGVIGYGKLRAQPDLSILQVGVGYGAVSKNVQFTVAPIGYNIGSKIPLMNNLYISPTVSMDVEGHFTIGAGLRVGL